MTFAEVQNFIYEAGITGAGGAGFPTHKKLAEGVDTVLVNIAECEPLMAVDKFVCKYYIKEINQALEALLDAMGANKGVLAVKHKNIEYVKSFSDRIVVKEVPDIYPAGDEVVLTYEALGKIIPQGKIPLAVGVMVINAETLLNVYYAIFEKKPFTMKKLCVVGDVDTPVSMNVPLGTPVMEVLEAAGVHSLAGKCVIDGGPLMGTLLTDPAKAVVTKRTKGLLILPEDSEVVRKKTVTPQSIKKRAASACCGCTMCTDMCPRYLLGYQFEVHKAVAGLSYGGFDPMSVKDATFCCGCGVCEMIACQQDVCPRHAATEGKGILAKAGIRYSVDVAPTEPRPERKNRLVPSAKMYARCGLTEYAKKTVQYIETPLAPKRVELMLSQHIGAPATPQVSVGDKVSVGDRIASVDADKMGANLHASINGKVVAVTDDRIILEK